MRFRTGDRVDWNLSGNGIYFCCIPSYDPSQCLRKIWILEITGARFLLYLFPPLSSLSSYVVKLENHGITCCKTLLSLTDLHVQGPLLPARLRGEGNVRRRHGEDAVQLNLYFYVSSLKTMPLQSIC